MSKESMDHRVASRSAVGMRRWAIPEGCIPSYGNGPAPELVSHDALCLLNAGTADACVELTLFFEDRAPAGPYVVKVPAQRTLHLPFNDLRDPEPLPLGKNYSSLIESDVPIVAQYTRLDSRQAENALLSTMAYPCE